jgi:hypothetical protein
VNRRGVPPRGGIENTCKTEIKSHFLRFGDEALTQPVQAALTTLPNAVQPSPGSIAHDSGVPAILRKHNRDKFSPRTVRKHCSEEKGGIRKIGAVVGSIFLLILGFLLGAGCGYCIREIMSRHRRDLARRGAIRRKYPI